MKTVKFEGCQHLTFDKSRVEIYNLILMKSGSAVCWVNPTLPGQMQVCEINGAMNKRTACLWGNAKCHKYVGVLHVIDMEK